MVLKFWDEDGTRTSRPQFFGDEDGTRTSGPQKLWDEDRTRTSYFRSSYGGLLFTILSVRYSDRSICLLKSHLDNDKSKSSGLQV